MFDVTIGRQINHNGWTKVLGVYQAYPYLTDSTGIYPNDHPYSGQFYASGTMYSAYKFIEGSKYAGHVMYDWEPDIETSGTTYWRPLDPKFNTISEITVAHKEYATGFNMVRAEAKANNARLGVYDFLSLIYRRNGDIVNDATFPTWVQHVTQVRDIVVDSGNGERLLDIIMDLDGKVWWTHYVIDAWNNSSLYTLQLKMLTRVSETLTSLGIPNAPILKYTSSQSNGVYPPLMHAMIDYCKSFYGTEWGMWGFASEITRDALCYVLDEQPTKKPIGRKKMQGLFNGPANTFMTDTSSRVGQIRPIQPGRCVNADGTNDVVTVANELNMSGLTSWAVAANINVDTTGSVRGIIGRQNQWGITVSNKLQFHLRNGAGTDISGIGGNISAGRWYPVILNVDNGVYNLSVDGVPAVTGSFVGLNPGTASSDTILNRYSAYSLPFDGKMSNVMIWQNSLSNDDVRNYINQKYKDLPDPYRWYKMDESQGTTCYDSASTNTHATYSNISTGTFFYTGSDVPFSFQNEYGYSNTTNLLNYSQNLTGSTWILANATIAQDGTLGPDGEKQAWKINQVVSGIGDNVTDTINLPAGQYTFECYLKGAGTGNPIALANNLISNTFNAVTPTIVSGAGTTVTQGNNLIQVHGLSTTDWTKIRLRMTSGTTVSKIFFYPSIVGQQIPGNSFYLYKPQIYLDPTISGYVETQNNQIYGRVPRNENNSLPFKDAVTGDLTNWGRVPYNPRPVASNCGHFEGGSNKGVLFGPTTLPIASNNLTLEYGMRSTQTGTLKYTLYLFDGVDTYLFAALGTVNNQISFFDGTWRNLGTAPHDGNPHKVKYAIVGNGLTLYIDDVAVGFTTITNRTISPATYVTIGANYDGTSSTTYDGDLWDLKLYSSGVLQLHVPFSEGSGTRVYDTVAGRTGVITGISPENFWGRRQNNYHHNLTYGYNLLTGVRIPAKINGTKVDARNNPVEFRPGNYHNGAETRLDFTSGVPSPSLTKISSGSGLYFQTGIDCSVPFGFNLTGSKVHFHCSINFDSVFSLTGDYLRFPILSQDNGKTIIGIGKNIYSSNQLYTNINGQTQYSIASGDCDMYAGKWHDLDVIIDNNQITAFVDYVPKLQRTLVPDATHTGNFRLGGFSGIYLSGHIADVSFSRNNELYAIYPLYKNGLDILGTNHLTISSPNFSYTPAITGYSYGEKLPNNITRSKGNNREFDFSVYDTEINQQYVSQFVNLNENVRNGLITVTNGGIADSYTNNVNLDININIVNRK
jgi:hypothetical protein